MGVLDGLVVLLVERQVILTDVSSLQGGLHVDS